MKQKIVFILLISLIFTLHAKAQSFIYLEIDTKTIDSTNIQVKVLLKNNTNKNIKIENPDLFKDVGFRGSQSWVLHIFDENRNHYCTSLGFYGKKDLKKLHIILKKRTELNFDFLINTANLFFCDYRSLDPVDINNTNQLKLKLYLIIDNEKVESNYVKLK